MRIDKIAQLVKEQNDAVTFQCWRSDCEMDCDESVRNEYKTQYYRLSNVSYVQSICCVPLPTSLRRLVIIVDSILKVIECPVCTATICPPVLQCQNGHLLCLDCRIRSDKCPMCRGFFTPIRSSVAEEIYSIITSAFQEFRTEGKLRHKIFGNSVLTKTKSYDSYNASKQRKPLLATNKILNKLLQSKAESLENLFHCNSAKLLRAESTDSFNVMNVKSANEKQIRSTDLTRTSKLECTTASDPERNMERKFFGSDSSQADSLLEQQDFVREERAQAEEPVELICQTTPIAVTAPSAINDLWSEPPVKAKSKSLAALFLLH